MGNDENDGFIGLPPGMVDSGTFRTPARTERPRAEKSDVVFVPTVPGMPIDAPAVEQNWVLTLPDGSTETVSGAVVIGRNPKAPAHWPTARPLAVADTTKSVSKTHALVELDGSGLWVHDLDSTNGVWVVVGDDATDVAPGRRAGVPAGASIELGDFVIRVERR